MTIPFSPPFIDDDVVREVVDSLQSGWITTGPKVRLLEEEVARLSQLGHVLCVNSATSGLILALKWFGIGAGDEVIVPAYTYAATALAVYHVGAHPIIVDICDNFTIDPEKVRQAITPKTKAVIPVDIAGFPANYDEIHKIIKQAGVKRMFKPANPKQVKLGRILVISDAAHSLGAIYKGRPVGHSADITVFSFHAVKNVTTAEGGAIALNLPSSFNSDDELRQMRLMSLNGQTKDAYTKTKAGGWKYDIILPGYKFNMPDVLAAIGLAQIKKYKNFLLPERKRIAKTYEKLLKPYDWALLPILEHDGSETSYHIYPLRIKNITEDQRDRIIKEISHSKIAVNVHFIPLPMLSFFNTLGYRIENFPVAYKNYSCEISLPIYPQLDESKLQYIVENVVKAYYSVVI